MPNNDQNKYEADKLEVQKRFEKLPNNLKKELLADKNAKLVLSIAQDYKLDEEQIKKVNLLVMEVFLGYLKPEEVASELHTFFDIDLQKANFIEIELKQKLLNPLKTDLEKNYNPPSLEEQEKTQKSDKLDSPVGEEPIIIKPEPVSITNDKKDGLDSRRGNDPSEIVRQNRNFTGQIEKEATQKGEAVNYSQQENAPAPFIIQTKDQFLKTTTSKPSDNTFRKDSSLNLKVDPSFIKKTSPPKPVSVHLETELPKSAKFGMPLTINNSENKQITSDKKEAKNNQTVPNIFDKIKSFMTTSSPKPKIEQKPITITPKPNIPISPINKPTPQPKKITLPTPPQSIQPLLKTSQQEKINIKKPTTSLARPKPCEGGSDQAIWQKPISELIENKTNLSQKEPEKIVHYIGHKTNLNNAGIPKKQESKKGDVINLTTFTKVSGNTVDLRSKSTD
ncbi:hypothetical protein KJ671_01230 [Patescibacteria group bacterium]|nr:hypothetical protein [Patescibacteria group bacterium]